MVARNSVLIEVFRANAQVQRFVALLLSRTLLEAAAFASQSQFYDLLLVIKARAFAADLNDALHVTALGSNEPPGNLELFVVVDLYVESTSILYVIILV